MGTMPKRNGIKTSLRRDHAKEKWDQTLDEEGMVIYKKNQPIDELEEAINTLEAVTNDWEKARIEEEEGFR